MAKVLYSRFCRELKKDKQTGKSIFVGDFDRFTLADGPVLFTFAVCWHGNVGETFRQSFAIVDADGNVLDATPETEYVLGNDPENLGSGFFYVVFPRIGRYSVNVYQNGNCIETVPFDVIEPK